MFSLSIFISTQNSHTLEKVIIMGHQKEEGGKKGRKETDMWSCDLPEESAMLWKGRKILTEAA